MNPVLQMLLIMLTNTAKTAGQMQRDKDTNDTGKDDLIGYTLIYVADLSTALLSGDTSKILNQLNKVAPEQLNKGN